MPSAAPPVTERDDPGEAEGHPNAGGEGARQAHVERMIGFGVCVLFSLDEMRLESTSFKGVSARERGPLPAKLGRVMKRIKGRVFRNESACDVVNVTRSKEGLLRRPSPERQIGRASCRERVSMWV